MRLAHSPVLWGPSRRIRAEHWEAACGPYSSGTRGGFRVLAKGPQHGPSPLMVDSVFSHSPVGKTLCRACSTLRVVLRQEGDWPQTREWLDARVPRGGWRRRPPPCFRPRWKQVSPPWPLPSRGAFLTFLCFCCLNWSPRRMESAVWRARTHLTGKTRAEMGLRRGWVTEPSARRSVFLCPRDTQCLCRPTEAHVQPAVCWLMTRS